jgi:hypothetical protein
VRRTLIKLNPCQQAGTFYKQKNDLAFFKANAIKQRVGEITPRWDHGEDGMAGVVGAIAVVQSAGARPRGAVSLKNGVFG